jgi:hypothetical protein
LYSTSGNDRGETLARHIAITIEMHVMTFMVLLNMIAIVEIHDDNVDEDDDIEDDFLIVEVSKFDVLATEFAKSPVISTLPYDDDDGRD